MGENQFSVRSSQSGNGSGAFGVASPRRSAVDGVLDF